MSRAVVRGSPVWELSEAILRIDRTEDYPVTVHAVEGERVLLSQDPDTVNPIPFGLAWPSGHVVLSAAVTAVPGLAGRTIASVTRGPLQAGVRAHLNCHVFEGDPRTARGLDFGEPVITGELGGLPAWEVPPVEPPRRPGTWVIAVHGRGADRREALRVLPGLSQTGAVTLVISYRNDVAATQSPDGYCHLGEDEWRDVAAAVRYALDRGAREVVLYGWSMGAMLALTALRRLPLREARHIRGLILDSPLLNWRMTLAWQARQRGVPQRLAKAATLLAERRVRLSLAALDQGCHARYLTVPVLLFADSADLTVPARSALRFARRRPHLVSLITTASGHGRGWNENPARYEAAVRAFLAARCGALTPDRRPHARRPPADGGPSAAAPG